MKIPIWLQAILDKQAQSRHLRVDAKIEKLERGITSIGQEEKDWY